MKQLAESRETLQALYKKYKMGPNDFKNVITPRKRYHSAWGQYCITRKAERTIKRSNLTTPFSKGVQKNNSYSLCGDPSFYKTSCLNSSNLTFFFGSSLVSLINSRKHVW